MKIVFESRNFRKQIMLQTPSRRRGGSTAILQAAAQASTVAVTSAVAIAAADKKTFAKRSLGLLKEHPRQQELFGDATSAEFKELVENIEQFGLQHPIEILPDNTIVAGHQRVRAARHLGWSEIDVVVRSDLAAAGNYAVEQHLINDNLVRRRLQPIMIAKIYRRLKKLEAENGSGNGSDKRSSLRDRLAAKLGTRVSGRTLDRYERLLDAPLVLRRAVEEERLPMSTALRIMSLPKARFKAAIKRIAAGDDPRRLARNCRRSATPSSSATAYRRLLAALIAANRDIGTDVSTAVGSQPNGTANAVAVLRQAVVLINQLQEAENRRGADCRTA